MLFSIIIPTFNRRDLLVQALESIKAQTIDNYELIVVDDGSTDGTVDVVTGHWPSVTCLQQSPHGPGAARNLGAHHASGDYLAFLDSDDLWFPWTLDTYAQAIQQNDGPAFLAGRPRCFSAPKDLKSVTAAPLKVNRFADYYASGDKWRWWGASSFVIRAEAFRDAGGFADAWINGEDADLAMRLGVAPGFVQICAPSTFGYREHAVSAMKNSQRTLEGAWHKVRFEQQGAYPGSEERAQERRRILTRHLRPVSLTCLQEGLTAEGWRLYRAMFRWHLALGRWKYLLGFPVQAWLRRNRAKVTSP